MFWNIDWNIVSNHEIVRKILKVLLYSSLRFDGWDFADPERAHINSTLGGVSMLWTVGTHLNCLKRDLGFIYYI